MLDGGLSFLDPQVSGLVWQRSGMSGLMGGHDHPR
jgi:hypothetical protein